MLTISINYYGEKLISKPYMANSSKIAEHKAAHELIQLIEQKQLKDNNIVKIKEDEVALLKSSNPKGKLLEWCIANKINPPVFEKRITSDGFNIKVKIIINKDNILESKWHSYPILKIAEHSACNELLFICKSFNNSSIKTLQSPSEERKIIGDPCSILNHLKQIGKIITFDLSQIEQTGPSHLPTFNIIGYLLLPNGKKLSTQQLEAHSKKEAQKLAAMHLIQLFNKETINFEN